MGERRMGGGQVPPKDYHPGAFAGEGEEEIIMSREFLIGRYQLQAAPDQILELRDDGVAVVNGQQVMWDADEAMLSLGPEMVPYRFERNMLTLDLGGTLVGWQLVSRETTGTGNEPD
jgi:hypothetical protein